MIEISNVDDGTVRANLFYFNFSVTPVNKKEKKILYASKTFVN